MLPIILASTSPFRAALLKKLQLPFTTCAPEIDETPLKNEDPKTMVQRLTLEKARKVEHDWPEHFIISSDQCAVFDGEIIGKPDGYSEAITQLQKFSGNRVEFLTGLCLLNTATGSWQLDVVPFYVHFRTLTTGQIENYLRLDQPYNCAGSFKSEGLGISLFSRLEGDDPNTLIGLPLIRLTDFFLQEGIELPVAVK